MAGLVLVVVAMSAALGAQPAARRGTTILALRNYPGFYHQQSVSVIGTLKGLGEQATLSTDEASVRLVMRDAPPEGRIEVRGQFLDIGRMSPEDPRLIPFNLTEQVRQAYQDRWPRPGEELLLVVSSTAPAPGVTNDTQPPLRVLAMAPERFAERPVTLIGQFRGRNLFGDLPESPVADKFLFIIRSADAAIWVTGLQPKGRDFSLDPSRRLDAGRWVQVTGTAHTAKGLVWMTGNRITLAEEPEDAVLPAEATAPPPPPVEVVFSAPTEGEIDVVPTTPVRMQLSRDLDPTTMKGQIQVTYPSLPPGETITATAAYNAPTRALEIRPPGGAWPSFTKVTIELMPGLKGTDGGPMEPFKLTFTTGG